MSNILAYLNDSLSIHLTFPRIRFGAWCSRMVYQETFLKTQDINFFMFTINYIITVSIALQIAIVNFQLGPDFNDVSEFCSNAVSKCLHFIFYFGMYIISS